MAMRDIITKDHRWKLLSLVLAGVIWFTVKDEDPDKSIRPLGFRDTRSFTNLPVLVFPATPDKREFRVNPPTVEVAVNGPEEFLSTLTESEILVTVNLSGF